MILRRPITIRRQLITPQKNTDTLSFRSGSVGVANTTAKKMFSAQRQSNKSLVSFGLMFAKAFSYLDP
jgi:hypothetical protein